MGIYQTLYMEYVRRRKEQGCELGVRGGKRNSNKGFCIDI